MLAICSRIVIPYDDSPLSKKALETAIKLAKQDIEIELDIITVVNVTMPASYYVALNVWRKSLRFRLQKSKENS